MKSISKYAATAAATLSTLGSCQITSPTAASSVVMGTPLQITWNTVNLKNPLNLFLAEGGLANATTTTATNFAVNIGNTGNYAWEPDASIPALSSYAIVLMDANNVQFVSESFAIQGLSAAVSTNAVAASIDSITTTRTRTTSTTVLTTVTNFPSTAMVTGVAAVTSSSVSTVTSAAFANTSVPLSGAVFVSASSALVAVNSTSALSTTLVATSLEPTMTSIVPAIQATAVAAQTTAAMSSVLHYNLTVISQGTGIGVVGAGVGAGNAAVTGSGVASPAFVSAAGKMTSGNWLGFVVLGGAMLLFV